MWQAPWWGLLDVVSFNLTTAFWGGDHCDSYSQVRKRGVTELKHVCSGHRSLPRSRAPRGRAPRCCILTHPPAPHPTGHSGQPDREPEPGLRPGLPPTHRVSDTSTESLGFLILQSKALGKDCSASTQSEFRNLWLAFSRFAVWKDWHFWLIRALYWPTCHLLAPGIQNPTGSSSRLKIKA